MRPFNRLFTAISVQFDELVGQIENHEAVAEASLRNLREDIRNAKVQYKMMEKDLNQTREIIEKNKKEKVTWEERAKKYAEEDKEKALHCMRRIKQCDSEQEILEQKEKDLEGSASHLKQQLLKVEGQYQALRSRIQSLSCRDHAATLKNKSNVSTCDTHNVDDVFSRWEKSITKKEVSGEIMVESLDPFQEEIEAEEEQHDLEMALNELVSK